MFNSLKTFLFLSALTALFMWVGHTLGGQSGLILALVFAAVMNFASYWFSDKMVLSMYRAQEVDDASAPQLTDLIRRLSYQAGIPMPRVFIIPTDSPNAFATGRDPDHAAVAVTEGLLRRLTGQELAGVLGHELAHIKNRDILIGSIVATFAGAISYLASMAQWGLMFGFGRSSDDDEGSNPVAVLVMAILAPVIAMLIQLAISRSREFAADHIGAQISGEPLALANALVKLENSSKAIPVKGGEATAHMFIVSPLRKGLSSLFRTHPRTEERVARLQEMAVSQGVLLF